MIFITLALGAIFSAQQDSYLLPYADSALQLEAATYFDDLVLIEVVNGTAVWTEREMTTSSGDIRRTMPSQMVRVIDSNFGARGQLKLVFPFQKSSDFVQAAARIVYGRPTIPLPNGRYIVSGKVPKDGILESFTGAMLGSGVRVPGEYGGTTVLTMSGSSDSFAVFSLFPTNARAIPRNGREPVDILSSLLTAGLDTTGEPLDVLDFFLRIKGRPIPESMLASESVVKIAKRELVSRPSKERALLLAVAFRFGDSSVNSEMFTTFVDSDVANPGWWDSADGAPLLRGAQLGSSSDDAYVRWLKKPARQIEMARLASQADSSHLRRWILAKMTSRHDPAMNPYLRRLVVDAQPEGYATDMLLRRMADLFEREDKKPERQRRGETKEMAMGRLQDLLDFWLMELGG